MDLISDTSGLTTGTVLARAAIFFGWLVAFMASMAAIGLIPTALLFIVAYMRLENREPWRLALPQAIGMTVFVYVVFDRLLAIPWPASLLGTLAPALKAIPSV
jgi:Tripartite tricarboxylate transporter TctB family